MNAASLSRRQIWRAGTALTAGFAIWPVRAAFADDAVSIVIFNDNGERQGTVELRKVVKTDGEWKAKLPSLSYDVTRRAGTEAPFSGDLLKEHRKGIFRCICCDTALFGSSAKYESHTGWPSFWKPIAKENVRTHADRTLGMDRTEISCALCGAHLGHVFHDGPPPTGLRYCMNSAALRFIPTA